MARAASGTEQEEEEGEEVRRRQLSQFPVLLPLSSIRRR